MGPYYVTAIVALLGPIRRVAGFASTRAIDRVIEIGPRAGTPFTPETPTHTAATLELDGGVTANLTATFEAGAQYIADFAVYGTEGRLILPDPNSYGGPLLLRRGREEAWQTAALPPPSPRDGRGLGLADLVTSVGSGAAPRASGELGLHVVEVARGILAAAEAGESVAIRERAVAAGGRGLTPLRILAADAALRRATRRSTRTAPAHAIDRHGRGRRALRGGVRRGVLQLLPLRRRLHPRALRPGRGREVGRHRARSPSRARGPAARWRSRSTTSRSRARASWSTARTRARTSRRGGTTSRPARSTRSRTGCCASTSARRCRCAR